MTRAERSLSLIHIYLPYGDQRKLEIARALATNPKLLLLDEPAAGMNPNETIELMDTIRFVRDNFDMTVLLIEHDMKLVSGICEEPVSYTHLDVYKRQDKYRYPEKGRDDWRPIKK